MVLITGGLSRTAALCCHRPKHTPASLQITVYLYTSLLPSYTPPPPSLSSFFPPCVRATFAIFLLTSGLDTFVLFQGEERGERERERDWMARARRRKIEWIEATRFLIHWFPQIDAERLAYGGVLSGNGYFAPATLLIPAWNIRTIQRVDRRKIYRWNDFYFFLFSFPFFFPLFERVYSFVDLEESNRVIFSSNLRIFSRIKMLSKL